MGDTLGRRLRQSRFVTRLIDGLVRAGLAERARSESEGGLSVAQIIRRGSDLVRRSPYVDRAIAELGGRLGRQDLRDLSRLCEKLHELDRGAESRG
jgi:hypothetical protein